MNDNADSDEHNDNDHSYVLDNNTQVNNCGSSDLIIYVSSASDRHLSTFLQPRCPNYNAYCFFDQDE